MSLPSQTTSISKSKMEATMFKTIALLRNPLRPVVFTLAALCATAVFFSAGQQAQTSKRPMELKDYFRVEIADSPAISPDGRWVAFARSYIVETENRRHSEIWLVPSDGSAAPARITNPAFSSSGPRWSPDGKLLAFVSRRKVPDGDESNAVWFLRMDQPGGEAFQIRGVTGTPIFSPDNHWIAFTKRTPPAAKSSKQYASDFERQINERFKGRIVDWMNYRFDGRGYLPDPRDPSTTPPEELYVIPRAGGTPKQFTKLGVNVESADWSPDGKALVIESNSHQRDEYQYERSDLGIVTLEGAAKRLTDDGYNHGNPKWSPDGRFVVFMRQQSLSQVIAAKQSHGSPVDVYRMPVEGGKMENLTADWDLLPGAPAPSADGRFVYFSGGIGGNADLFRVPAGGGKTVQVTQGDRVLGSFGFSTAFDRTAYTGSDPTHPSEVFSARIDGANEKKLSGVNDAFLSEVEIRPAERLLYPSKDGAQIEGWLILPRGYDAANGKYPLILNIHGGPHGAYTNSFSAQFQLFAANGYAVLYANPRGSTNYGEKFL